MAIQKSITTFVASFLILGFIILALPQTGHSQEIESGCCQYGLESGERSCVTTHSVVGLCPKPLPPTSFDGFFPDETCNEQTGFCSGIDPEARNVPTLSEWGMIAMAGVLGIVGFMVARRRKVTA